MTRAPLPMLSEPEASSSRQTSRSLSLHLSRIDLRLPRRLPLIRFRLPLLLPLFLCLIPCPPPLVLSFLLSSLSFLLSSLSFLLCLFSSSRFFLRSSFWHVMQVPCGPGRFTLITRPIAPGGTRTHSVSIYGAWRFPHRSHLGQTVRTSQPVGLVFVAILDRWAGFCKGDQDRWVGSWMTVDGFAGSDTRV
jgi:hypothetical protein